MTLACICEPRVTHGRYFLDHLDTKPPKTELDVQDATLQLEGVRERKRFSSVGGQQARASLLSRGVADWCASLPPRPHSLTHSLTCPSQGPDSLEFSITSRDRTYFLRAEKAAALYTWVNTWRFARARSLGWDGTEQHTEMLEKVRWQPRTAALCSLLLLSLQHHPPIPSTPPSYLPVENTSFRYSFVFACVLFFFPQMLRLFNAPRKTGFLEKTGSNMKGFKRRFFALSERYLTYKKDPSVRLCFAHLTLSHSALFGFLRGERV